MPTVGFGTAGLAGDTAQAVMTALKVGYKLIDTAQASSLPVSFRWLGMQDHATCNAAAG